MIELRFHRDLYAGVAVDEAVKAYARFAEFQLEEAPGEWIVRITARTSDREKKVARELGNMALGLTVRKRESS